MALQQEFQSRNGYSFSFRNSLEKSFSENSLTEPLNQTMRDQTLQRLQQTPKFINQGLEFLIQSNMRRTYNRKNKFAASKLRNDSVESFGDKRPTTISTLQPFINNNNNTKIGKIQINYNNYSSPSSVPKFRFLQNNQSTRSQTYSNRKYAYLRPKSTKKKPTSIEQIYLQKIRQRILDKNNSKMITLPTQNLTTVPEKLILTRNTSKKPLQKQYNRTAFMQKRFKNDKLKDLNQGLKNIQYFRKI